MSLLQALVLDRQVLLGGMKSASQTVHPPQFSGACTRTQSSCFQLKRNLLRTIMQITNSAGGQGIRLGGRATLLQRLRVETLLPPTQAPWLTPQARPPCVGAPARTCATALLRELHPSPANGSCKQRLSLLPDAARQWKSRAGASDRGVQVT